MQVWTENHQQLFLYNCPLSSSPQSCRAEESQARPKDPLRCSLPDVGLEQWFEFREDQLQPLEPPLPQAAAEPHEVWIQGSQTLQYPSSASHIHWYWTAVTVVSPHLNECSCRDDLHASADVLQSNYCKSSDAAKMVISMSSQLLPTTLTSVVVE